MLMHGYKRSGAASPRIAQSAEGGEIMEMNEEKIKKAEFVKGVLAPLLREPSLRTNVVDAVYSINPTVRDVDWYIQADAGLELPRDLDYEITGMEWVILTFKDGNKIGINVSCNSHLAILRDVLRKNIF